MTLRSVFWFLFALDAALHLFACIPSRMRTRLRVVTKALLMPLLAVCYLLSAKVFSPLVFAGLLFGFLGDVFLIAPHNKKLFACGLCSFAVGHAFYITYFGGRLNAVPSVPLLALLLVLGAVGAALFLRFLWSSLEPPMRAACGVYMADILFMAISAALFFLAAPSPFRVLAPIGGVLFLVSDSVLAIATFKRAFHYRYLIVMGTYIFAQTLIALSCALG